MTLVSVILVTCLGINVWHLPESKSKNEWIKLLVIRSIAGHACFITFQYSFLFAPVSVLIIIFQTNPFYTSILAYFVNGEVLLRYELFGMMLCFIGICVLGNAVKSKQEPDITDSTFGSS